MSRPRNLQAILCTLGLLLRSSSSVSAWQVNGNPICTAPGLQQLPSGVADGTGGVYLAWLDARGGNNVYAQRITAAGSIAPGWPVNGVALTTGGGAGAPTAASDGNGGLLVVYFRAGICAQRVTASGAIAPGFPADGKVVTTDVTSGIFAAASDGAGGAFIFRLAPPPPPQFYAQAKLTRITADGVIAPGWTVNGLFLDGGDPVIVSGIVVKTIAQGGAVCVWGSRLDVQVDQTYGRLARIRLDGVVAQSISVDAPLSGHQVPGVGPIVGGPDGRNGLLATWRDAQPNTFPYTGQIGYFGGHWDSSSVSRWPSPTSLPLVLTPVPDGTGATYLIGKPAGQNAFFAYRRASDGTIPAGWTASGIPLSNPVLTENYSSLAIPDGLLTCWSETLNGPEYDIRAVVLTPSGSVAGGWAPGGSNVCTAPGNQLSPILVPDGVGGVVACWVDQRDNATTGQDIYAAQLLAGGVVPALASLAGASAEPRVIRLHWFSPDGASFMASLERDANGAGFAPLAEVRADGTGHVRYEDRDVVAGATYRYRLVVAEAAGPSILGEVTLRVPDALALALGPARPNPSAGPLTLEFVLPSAAPARIEVLDVIGRRVLSRPFSAAGAGRHLLAMNDDLAPGVYVVRLTHEGRSVTTRVVRSE